MPGFNLDEPRQDIGGILNGGNVPQINSAPPSAPKTNADPLANLSPVQRIGLALQNFSAGVAGRELPSDVMKKKAEDGKRQELADFKTITDLFSGSLKSIRSLAPEKRQQATDLMAEKMDAISPGTGELFKSFNGDPILSDGVLNIFGKDQGAMVQNIHFGYCQGDRECTLKMLGDKDFMDRVREGREAEVLPVVDAKVDAILKNIGRLVSKSEIDSFKRDDGGNVVLNVGDLQRINSKAPEQMKLTDAEFSVLIRNQSSLLRHGIMTDDLLKKQAEHGIERGGLTSTTGKIIEDLDKLRAKGVKESDPRIQSLKSALRKESTKDDSGKLSSASGKIIEDINKLKAAGIADNDPRMKALKASLDKESAAEPSVKSSSVNTIYRLAVGSQGGVFDENGNIKSLDPGLSGKVQEITATAANLLATGEAGNEAEAVSMALGKPTAKPIPPGLPEGTEALPDGTFKLPNGQIVRPKK